jgi:uncharacterized cupredoxin-like copper-binding protein
MRMNAALRFPLSLLAGLALHACAKTEKAPEAPQAVVPATVHVTAADYSFQAPDTLTSGLTTFHLMNEGKELHHLVLVRLAPGQTAADLQKLSPDAPPPPGVVMIGGPNFSAPGGTAEATVDLKPGNYAMICLIPSSADGKLHLMKGMIRGLTVTEGTVAVQSPSPDLTIKLSDYSFESSGPLTAGHHVIRVENTAAQMHELVFVKLEAGKTQQQLMEWIEKPMGPPPAVPLNGVSPLSMGEANFVTVDLTPGEYAFICFVSDAKDGKPHFMHGMTKAITVM